MEVLLFFAFISGFVTILAPCIWPLLPIILSSSVNGGKSKSLGITLGIMVSFAFFTLSISYLVNLFGIDPNIIRIFAVVVLVILGLTMIIPAFSLFLEGIVSKLSGRFGQTNNNRNGFWGGFLTGASLGIVWTPCTGPILAAIATLAATTQLNSGIVLVTLAYVLGLGIPLFIFSYGGQKLISKTRFIGAFTGRVQQIFGVILLITAIGIYTGYDKVVQIKLLNLFPSYTSALISLENNSEVKKQLQILKGQSPQEEVQTSVVTETGRLAPEFTGITEWLNTESPVKIADLKGKVVLIDFWTYTCINCIRTMPYITSWDQKYRDKGFVVIGVHTPEFEFEKKKQNVEDAIKRYNIKYPVAQDNDFSTWRAYDNQYWPAKYLIDAKGQIRYTHFGEGKYEETEKAIQQLLKEAGSDVAMGLSDLEDQTPTEQTTPEIYLGSERMLDLYPDFKAKVGTKTYTLEKNIPLNKFAFGGQWQSVDQYSQPGTNALLQLEFKSKKVFLVMKSDDGTMKKVRVLIDGKVVENNKAGLDVKDGVALVDSDRLYELVDFKTGVETHSLTLEFPDGGVQVFAFTFGS